MATAAEICALSGSHPLCTPRSAQRTPARSHAKVNIYASRAFGSRLVAIHQVQASPEENRSCMTSSNSPGMGIAARQQDVQHGPVPARSPLLQSLPPLAPPYRDRIRHGSIAFLHLLSHLDELAAFSFVLFHIYSHSLPMIRTLNMNLRIFGLFLLSLYIGKIDFPLPPPQEGKKKKKTGHHCPVGP